MWLPLAVLATVTVVIGLLGFVGLNQGFAYFLNGGVNVAYATAPGLDTLTYVGVGTAVVGIVFAWAMYGVGVIPATIFTGNPIGAFIYRVLKNKYYLDEFYNWLIQIFVMGTSRLAVLFDQYVLDGIVNGSARFVRGLGVITRRSETGALQNVRRGAFRRAR